MNRQPKILAIDDTPANLMTLGAALEDEFDLQFATSGPEGIALALQSLPDLILLDVMMPEVDGFETFRRLANQPLLKHIPVVFVTALDNVESEVAGLSLGAADYISKPVNVVIARQRIRNLLERERLRQAVQAQAAQLRKLVVAVEQSPASVVITDLDACLEYVNPRFTEVTGYSADEVLGRNPRILQSGLTSKATYENMWAALTRGLPWTGELVNKRKNGDTYWEEAQVAPVKDDAGKVTHYVAVKTDISERKQAEAIFRGLFEQSAFLAGILDSKGILLDVNATALSYTEATREQLIGQYFPDTPWWNDPQDRANLLSVLYQAYGGTASSCEARHTRSDGTSIDVLFSATPIHLATHTRLAVVGVDITARKLAEKELRLAANVFSHSHEGIAVTDGQGVIVEVNSSFTRITGYSRSEAVGQNLSMLRSGRHDQAFFAAMWADFHQKHYWSGDIWNKRKNGEVYPEMLTVSAVTDAEGHIQQYVALFADISERKAMEEQVHRLAFYDALTGLPNRRLLNDRLHQAMAASKRSGAFMAVMYLDLDNFKPLNDTHGHAVGDLLLQEVTRRLVTCLREVDTVSRMGGDEFVVLLDALGISHISSTEQAEIVAEKIRASLEEPYELQHKTSVGSEVVQIVNHRCSASIGVVIFSGDQTSGEQILNCADTAMYEAKKSGKNVTRFYEKKVQS